MKELKNEAYESNDETTTGRQGRCHYEDIDELVRAVQRGAGRDGPEAQGQGAAAACCGIHGRKILHRRVSKWKQTETGAPECRTFAIATGRKFFRSAEENFFECTQKSSGVHSGK